MKKALLFLVLLSFTNNYSQNKQIIYSNDDLNIISEEEYKANPLKKYFYEYKTENDTIILFTKASRVKEGNISVIDYAKIKDYLINITNYKISSSKTIIINYHPGKDKCNSGKDNTTLWSLYTKYRRKISKNKSVAQFFIYKSIDGTEKHPTKIKWYKDVNQLIEKHFFKFHYPCGSYIIIKPNGNYYSVRGEYRITDILDKIKSPHLK